MHSAHNVLSSDAQREYLELIAQQERLRAAQQRLGEYQAMRLLSLLAAPAILLLGAAVVLTTPIILSTATALWIAAISLVLTLTITFLVPMGIDYKLRMIQDKQREVSRKGHQWWERTARAVSQSGAGELQIPSDGLHLQADAVRLQDDGQMDTVHLVRSGDDVMLRGSNNQRIGSARCP